METFDTHFGAAARQGPPRAVRALLCRNHDYLTFAGECTCPQTASYAKFAVIGTDYGILRRTDGEPRFWHSASGARHALRRYREAHPQP